MAKYNGHSLLGIPTLLTMLTLEKRRGAHESQHQESRRIHPYKVTKLSGLVGTSGELQVSSWSQSAQYGTKMARRYVSLVWQSCGKSETYQRPYLSKSAQVKYREPSTRQQRRSRRKLFGTFAPIWPWEAVGNLDTPTSTWRSANKAQGYRQGRP